MTLWVNMPAQMAMNLWQAKPERRQEACALCARLPPLRLRRRSPRRRRYGPRAAQGEGHPGSRPARRVSAICGRLLRCLFRGSRRAEIRGGAHAAVRARGIAVKRQATYADLEAVPPHLVAEIIDGELLTHPRPSPRHGIASNALSSELAGPFQKGRGGPGGWIFIDEPELRLGPHVVVPDIAGWRRERLHDCPETAYYRDCAGLDLRGACRPQPNDATAPSRCASMPRPECRISG